MYEPEKPEGPCWWRSIGRRFRVAEGFPARTGTLEPLKAPTRGETIEYVTMDDAGVHWFRRIENEVRFTFHTKYWANLAEVEPGERTWRWYAEKRG